MKKIVYFSCLFFQLGLLPLLGQPRQLPSIYGTSVADDLCNTKVLSLSTDGSIQSIIDTLRLRLKIKVPINAVECTAASNCEAKPYRGTQNIVYNPNFIGKLRGLQFSTAKLPKVDWRVIGVLTHKISHLMLFHQARLLDDEYVKIKQLELEADSLSGTYCYQLGASLEQAQLCMYCEAVTSEGSYTHPPRQQRLDAIARGYNKAAEQNKVSIKEKIVNMDDRDNDGLANSIDKCPDEKGPAKNDGCPETTPTPNPTRKDQPQLPEMVFVRGGTFTMGDVMGDGEYSYETQHEVTVSDFYIGKYEVTFEEYDLFCEATGTTKPDDGGWGRGKRPVINVSWDNATAYCAWASRISGKTYRLPTEAEWEYAARSGGKKVRFGNGKNTLDPGEANFDGSASGKKAYSVVGEYRAKTVPVGSFVANSLGLYDMTGSVWEWCSDWYGSDYYANSPRTNPQGPSSGSEHVFRGGCLHNFPRDCRIALRGTSRPDTRFNHRGFRVASSQ